MEYSAEEIILMKSELSELRQQNKKLKKIVEEYQQKEEFDQYNLIRSTVQPMRYNQENDKYQCQHCKLQRQPCEKNRKQLLQEFQVWSLRLNNNFPMKKHLSEIPSSQGSKQEVLVHQFFENTERQMPLIEQVCLFGPNEKQMMESDRNARVSHQLYFPLPVNPSIEVYGNYLYPEKVSFKVVRQQKKDVDIDKILFRKSFKQQDCSIFIFQCRQQRQEQQQSQNDLLKQINPFKSLYIIGLQFNDYLFSDKPYQRPDKNSSFGEDKIEQLNPAQDSVEMPSEIKRDNSVYGETCIFKSNFFLCILSYFPFIDFYCQLIIKLIDHIKIRRMQIQTEKGKNYADLDIKYVARQLQCILKQLSPTLHSFLVQQNSKLDMNFGAQHLSLNLEGLGIKQNLMWDWAFRILRLLDRQTLYQIYCLVMLEESVCVICQNTFILTFVIHLLVSLLPKPFIYPHPIVSIVFQQELLQTPFTAILGINKGTKWLESNDSVFAEKMAGKVILNLNDDQVKLKSKRRSKLPKSQKLKKIFTAFYKKAEKIQKTSNRRQTITRQITKQQNELTLQLQLDLQQFYKEEVLNFMPNKEIIDSIRSNIISDNSTLISTRLIKNIEQYIVQSRKNRQNDPMVDLLMQKQIFYVYLTERYDIV